MSYQIIDGIPVWGEPLTNAVAQMANCLRVGAYKSALCADHHLGYAVPIGGVLAYHDKVSPSAVGYDIGCGNRAVRLAVQIEDIRGDISKIMDDVVRHFSFGMGRKNNQRVDHPLFHDDPAWDLESVQPLKSLAQDSLGTLGGGNHHLCILHDEQGRVWLANHFGSRGLGHKIATHYIKAGGGKDGINVDPVVLDVNSDLGREYIMAMALAGRFAYAGRDWVLDQLATLMCGSTEAIVESIHSHHNYAWLEEHDGEKLWVVRKGATPAFPGQKGFVGASMGEPSVIIEGIDSEEARLSLRSAPHGAGRQLSRTEAAGKVKWKNGVKTRVSQGKVSQEMMHDWVKKAGVELRGAGVDESPHCYKRLTDVLAAHSNTLKVIHTLTPVGVAMAGDTDFDPWKD